MARRVEDEIRQGARAMHDASTSVEKLLPPGFDGPPAREAAPAEEIVLTLWPVRRRRGPGMAVGAAAATILLVAVPLILILLLSSRDTDVATTVDARPSVVVQTLYADGAINDCPDNLANDTSHPAGEITYTPVSGGVEIRVVVEDAARDWAYVVHVFEELQPPAEHCANGLVTVAGLTTDSQGQGELVAVLPLVAGVHSLGVNIAYETIAPPESRHREISATSYATFTVPRITDP